MLEHFRSGVNFFWGVKFRRGGGGVKFFDYENVSICNNYHVSGTFRTSDLVTDISFAAFQLVLHEFDNKRGGTLCRQCTTGPYSAFSFSMVIRDLRC